MRARSGVRLRLSSGRGRNAIRLHDAIDRLEASRNPAIRDDKRATVTWRDDCAH